MQATLRDVHVRQEWTQLAMHSDTASDWRLFVTKVTVSTAFVLQCCTKCTVAQMLALSSFQRFPPMLALSAVQTTCYNKHCQCTKWCHAEHSFCSSHLFCREPRPLATMAHLANLAMHQDSAGQLGQLWCLTKQSRHIPRHLGDSNGKACYWKILAFTCAVPNAQTSLFT